MLTILGHGIWFNSIKSQETVFDAYNYDIGSDGGLKFEFKKGGYIFGRSIDHFSETFYFGEFSLHKDTLELNIPLDFPLSKQGYIYGDSVILFKNDPKKFYIR